MVIKIITIHDIGNNFGSTLQACALNQFLIRSGYKDTMLINYKPDYLVHNGKFGNFIKRLLFFKSYNKQSSRFKQYLSKNGNLTKLYTSYDELYKNSKSDLYADIYIVGSDQLWNEFWGAGKDDAYCLKFTDSNNKISYAASLGQLHTEEELNRLKEKIKDFSFISVRERASVSQLNSVGLDKVVHVLDPVFLLDKNDYIDESYVNKYGDYLLVYSINNDKLMDKTVETIAKKYNLKIVLIGGYLQKCPHNYYLRDAGPVEFVNLIANAKYVVANSFHATAFSIIFNKQFVVVQPNISPLRLTDMLEVAETGDRVVRTERDINKIQNDINYENVNFVIAEHKKRSQECLLNAISRN